MSDSGADHGARVFDEAAAVLELRRICIRLLQIDSTCNSEELGCPVAYVAEPMLVGYRDQFVAVGANLPDSVRPRARKLLYVPPGDRACEIGEIQALATICLEATGGVPLIVAAAVG